MIKKLCGGAWIRRKSWPKPKPGARALRIVDLFSGCGGLSLGAFEAARVNGRRLKPVLAVDIDEIAIAVYRSNFAVGANVARREDLTRLFAGRLSARLTATERKLRQRSGKVDLLIAGPPCQGHSDLNNSTRRRDPRNALYLRVVRAAKVLQPRAVIIENVPSVVHDKGRVVARAAQGLKAMGYDVVSSLVSADEIGLAQTRRRHVLVAVRHSRFNLDFLKQSDAKKVPTVKDYIGDLVSLNGSRVPLFDFASGMSKENQRRARFLYREKKYDLPDRLRPVCHRDFEHSYVSMYGRLRWDRPAQTITSGFGSMGQGRFLHPSKCRTLTPHEAARLQGFPDFFSFASVKARGALQTVIGNAVPPLVAAIFVDQLIRQNSL